MTPLKTKKGQNKNGMLLRPATLYRFAFLVGLVFLGVGCQPPANPGIFGGQHFVARSLQEAQRAEARGGEVLNVAFVVLEEVYNSELMAPYDVIQHTIFRDDSRYMLPFIVSPDGNPVTTFEGITVFPHFNFENVPDVDILVIPSTAQSMDADLKNKAYMDWLAKTIATASYVITVCDGAFPLAATGVLDGRMATTFPGDRERFAEQFPEVTVRYDQRVVVDGKYITSVGGALSYEPAFYLVETLYGKENADLIAQGLVWDWDLEALPHLVVPHSP